MNLVVDCLTPWSLIINQFSNHACGDLYTSGLPTDSFSFFEYFPIFLKTFLLELPVYYLILKSIKSRPQILFANLIINLTTHPIIFILMPIVFVKLSMDYLHYLMIAEIFAPTVEALLLISVFKVNWRYAVFSALAANLFSWTIGIYWN